MVHANITSKLAWFIFNITWVAFRNNTCNKIRNVPFLETFYSKKLICFLFKCVYSLRSKLINRIMDIFLLGSFVSYTCVFINVLY